MRAHQPSYIRSKRNLLSDEEIIEALRKTFGNLTRTALELKIHRNTMTKILKDRPHLLEHVEQGKQTLVDMAESVVASKLMQQDAKMAQFVLNTMGKNRGWTARHEMHHTAESSVVFYLPDNSGEPDPGEYATDED